ncbi:hypothetical protein [Kitasatospora sp. NPDC057223]|uniref:hypothetical protein n=1 Tax=Kitasatospora sp. NPDC057223 TaxID=3346055 RepID=UPI00363267DA
MIFAPPWLGELLAEVEPLAADDHVAALRDPDWLPGTIRLGRIGQSFADRADELTPAQRRLVLRVLERELAVGSEETVAAIATGFFEALLNAWDQGFDLRPAWEEMGPESRAHCRAWNRFGGIREPGWMR